MPASHAPAATNGTPTPHTHLRPPFTYRTESVARYHRQRPPAFPNQDHVHQA
ncbi:hypothetical protein P691DRAFT_800327 [Macrolepiota fuliginosa MF-IS2]|uniref:Uncharacterized protein n=1 Tax=Macrolepiota fuliginosa MF-IS2 TaxID=1400762 RepID=A0A9P5XDM7_9AGAR|nr:hypothetical protein P691DRAFT_800327 [Macrolepiota fuliginosa MF-IS2]